VVTHIRLPVVRHLVGSRGSDIQAERRARAVSPIDARAVASLARRNVAQIVVPARPGGKERVEVNAVALRDNAA